jgi:hypothetical protein
VSRGRQDPQARLVQLDCRVMLALKARGGQSGSLDRQVRVALLASRDLPAKTVTRGPRA